MLIKRTKSGESLYDVASEYAISAGYIAEVCEMNPRAVCEGREVIIPLPSRTAVAKSGDTVTGLAHRYGVRAEDIMALNPGIAASGRLYPSEYVVLKLAEPRVGVALLNGRIFPGVAKGRVARSLRYLDTLTIGAAVAEGRRIRCDSRLCGYREMAEKLGVDALLRIYIREMPRGEWDEFALGAVMAARGFCGVVLGGLSHLGGNAEEFIVRVKRTAIEAGLTLGVEVDGEGECGYAKYADTVVCQLDRLHLSAQPSFDECEGAMMDRMCDGEDVSNRLIDLPSFAISDGEYIARDEVFDLLERSGAAVEFDESGECFTARRGRVRATTESIGNTEKRIRAACDRGFLGLSADIGRMPFCELYMAWAMTMRPVNFSVADGGLNCLGEKKSPSD